MDPVPDSGLDGHGAPPPADELRSELDSALGVLDGGAPAPTETNFISYFAERPKTVGDSSLYGDARSISIGDILGFLSSLGKTGLLWVSTARERFLLQLQGGAVVFAQSDRPPPGSRLGEILVERGALAPDHLALGIQQARESSMPLGAWLLQNQLVTGADLRIALALQVQQIFNRMFTATDATYQFEEGKRIQQSEEVRLNVVQLLLESARNSDEGLRGVNMPVPLGRALD